MKKGSGTRSGLLWEVERVLKELRERDELPQVLVMENVTQVHGEKNWADFEAWKKSLQDMGYCNFWQDLIATDYGVPQTRDRTFMVSILGDYNYNFPKPVKLEKKLCDLLEEEVDEKYFLSDAMIDYLTGVNQKESKFPRGERFEQAVKSTNQKGIANCISTNAGNRPVDNFVTENSAEDFKKWKDNRGNVFMRALKGANEEGIAATISTAWNRPTSNFITEDTKGIEDYMESKKAKVKLKRGYECEVKTEETYTNDIDLLGNYSKSNYDSTKIVGTKGSAPTVRENHGQVTAIPIRNATKQGYLLAEEGDGVDISGRMETHRGTVQKGKAQTLTKMGGANLGVVVKNERK